MNVKWLRRLKLTEARLAKMRPEIHRSAATASLAIRVPDGGEVDHHPALPGLRLRGRASTGSPAWPRGRSHPPGNGSADGAQAGACRCAGGAAAEGVHAPRPWQERRPAIRAGDRRCRADAPTRAIRAEADCAGSILNAISSWRTTTKGARGNSLDRRVPRRMAMVGAVIQPPRLAGRRSASAHRSPRDLSSWVKHSPTAGFRPAANAGAGRSGLRREVPSLSRRKQPSHDVLVGGFGTIAPIGRR